MSKLFTIDVQAQMSAKMAEITGQINEQMKQLAQQATRDLAEATFYRAHSMANEKLHTTAGQYTDALKYEEISPGVYSVSLGEEAEHLESGYSSFDMKPGLLANATKKSKAGYPYRVIPFKHGDGQSSGDMLSDLKRLRKGFDDKGLTKDANGSPMLGKIFSVTKNDTGLWLLNGKQPGVESMTARFAEPAISPNLVGLTKTQYSVKQRNGGAKVKSAYVTFRVVSGDPKYASKWIHPGYGGIHLFDELSTWAEQQMAKVIKGIFG